MHRLETLARSVRENKAVNEASNYCRWLQFCGLINLFKLNPQPPPLRVDAAEVTKLLRDILYECGERFRNGKADAKYAESDIAEINRKLDILAAYVGQFAPPVPEQSAETADTVKPVLCVIEGGAQ